MKRFAGILFISVYMLAFAELHQLLRIPFLVEHFNFHRATEPGMTFARFMNIHYLGPVVMDDDFMQDQQLPFRDVDCHMMIGSTVCAFEPASFVIDPPAMLLTEFNYYNESNPPQFAAFDIFQPPRCA